MSPESSLPQSNLPVSTVEDSESEQVAEIVLALDKREAFLAKYEQELAANPELTERPDEWYETDIPYSLETTINRPEDIFRLYDIWKKSSSIMDELDFRKFGEKPVSTLSGTFSLFDRIDSNTLALAFTEESSQGPMHADVLRELDWPHAQSLVCSAYNITSLFEVFRLAEDEFLAQLKTKLLDADVLQSIFYQQNEDGFSRESSRSWMLQTFQKITELDVETADKYIFSASSGSRVTEELIKVVKVFQHFGIERLKKLSEVTGIYGIECYSIEQLERMEVFAVNPETYAETLNERDVVVSLLNRTGDYSHVMGNSAEMIDDTDNPRTLFFEINSPIDIYRKLATLAKYGIKPSTIIVSAHGSSGGIFIEDDRKPDAVSHPLFTSERLEQFTSSVPNQKPVAVENAFGLSHIIDEYMKESAGKDDSEGDIGRKKLVLVTCEGGVKYQEEHDSFIAHLAKDLQAIGTRSAVDIYGAPDSIQIQRTDRGLMYTGDVSEETKIVNGEKQTVYARSKLHAVKCTLENGTISETEVSEIVLRK